MPTLQSQGHRAALAAVLGGEQDLPHAGHCPTSRSSTSSTCSPIPAAPACTSAIPRATPPPTSSPATAACAASTSCTRWAGTPSACPPSSTPSRPAPIRASPPQKNIDTFRRQIKMLGFSYDWDREVDTTDPGLLQVDAVDLPATLRHLVRRRRRSSGRPIAELPIPPEVQAQGDAAVRALPRQQTAGLSGRGAGQLVPGAGHGAGQRGSHRRQVGARRPSRRPHAAAAVDAAHHRLRRAAARRPGAGRLARSRSRRCSATGSAAAKAPRSISRWPARSARRAARRIRVFTTRPDTLFGATYMVLSPEHPLVDRITTPAQQRRRRDVPGRGRRARATWSAPSWPRRRPASSPAPTPINPVNDETIPIWIADYVLASYGTGAIMAVPAHDERDFEFAKQFDLPIRTVVQPPDEWLKKTGSTLDNLTEALRRATASPINSGAVRRPADAGVQAEDHRLAGGAAAWASARSTTSCATGSSAGSATGASRSRSCTSWTPTGKPTGVVEPLSPERAAAAPARAGGLQAVRQARAAAGQGDRLGLTSRATASATAARRTRCRSGPARAGTTCATSTRRTTRRSAIRQRRSTGCRSISTSAAPSTPCCTCSTRASGTRCCSTAATCHTPEPFQRLVNQGMILGEMEFTGFQRRSGDGWVSAEQVDPATARTGRPASSTSASSSTRTQVEKKGDAFVLKDKPGDPHRRPRLQDVQEPRQRHQSRRGRRRVRRRQPAALRDVHGPAGGDQAVEHARRRGRLPLPEPRLAADHRRPRRGDEAGRQRAGRAARPRRRCASCTRRSRR